MPYLVDFLSNVYRRLPYAALALGVAGLPCISKQARAGVPECGGMRVEDAFNCEIRGNVSCSASCEDLGIYKKACATKLHTVCRDTCTLDPEPSCEDECTTVCQEQCDAGISVICQHNCFGECSSSCTDTCANAEEPSTCRASCEATCDGECDIQCAPVVSGSCYQHCIECCGGSCGAQANMTCQTSCQREQFETCEYEFRADCMASCTGDGALFCDGDFVLAGDQIDECVAALIALSIEAIGEGLDELDDFTDDLDIDLDNGGFCSVTPRDDLGPLPLGAVGLGMLGLLGVGGVVRRRRERPRA